MNAPILFISGAEIAFILFVSLLLFGADKLPEIIRGIGNIIRSLRSARTSVEEEIKKATEKSEFKEHFRKAKEKFRSTEEEIKSFGNTFKNKF